MTNPMFTALFSIERETKGTFRYKECDQKGEHLEQMDCKIGTLYIRKTHLGNNAPAILVVTVEELMP